MVNTLEVSGHACRVDGDAGDDPARWNSVQTEHEICATLTCAPSRFASFYNQPTLRVMRYRSEISIRRTMTCHGPSFYGDGSAMAASNRE
jgi:hypothetical protein